MAKSGSKTNAKRKHVEELQESEDRFRILTEDAPVLLWVNGLEGGEFVNRAYLEFLGVSGQVDIQRYDWSQYIHPDDREGYLSKYLECFSQQAPFEAAFRFCRHDGEYRWMKSVGQPRFNSSGEFYGYIGSTQDITDVKVMEDELRKARDELEAKVEQRTKALRESEKKYRELVENANSIILRCDRNGCITFFNEYAQKFFGYSLDKIIGKDVTVLVPKMESTGRDLASLVKDIKSAPKHYANVVNENMRKNGERVWVSWTNRAIRDEYGNVAEITIIGNDITERKRAEDALRESKAKLQAVFDNMTDAVFFTDVDGNFIDYNRAFVTYHRFKEKEECIRVLTEYPDYLDAWFEDGTPASIDTWPVRRAVRGESGEDLVFKIRRKDTGETWWGSYGYAPIRDNNGMIVGSVVVGRDITERMRVEEALALVHRQFQSVIDNTPAIVYAFDQEERFVMANTALAELLGSTPEQMIGKRRHEFMPKEDADWHEANDRQAIEAGRALEFEEYSQLKDRSITWLTTKFPLRDARGKIYAVAGISADISERKRAEEALKDAKQQAELYLDLMGHDISNMHQIIMGNLEIAQDILVTDGRLDSANMEMIDTSVATLQRSAKLIENIRNIQKLRSGEYKSEKMDLGVVLDDAVKGYSDLPGRNISIGYEPVYGYFVMSNPLLKDVFINLLDNAVKHCADPVRIDVGLAPVSLNGSHYHRVIVEDNGHGIPDDRKSLLFTRMKRGETKAKGTGLGLYIVRTLVEGFGGTVSVEDRVKGDHTKGARFVVMLQTVD